MLASASEWCDDRCVRVVLLEVQVTMEHTLLSGYIWALQVAGVMPTSLTHVSLLTKSSMCAAGQRTKQRCVSGAPGQFLLNNDPLKHL